MAFFLVLKVWIGQSRLGFEWNNLPDTDASRLLLTKWHINGLHWPVPISKTFAGIRATTLQNFSAIGWIVWKRIRDKFDRYRRTVNFEVKNPSDMHCWSASFNTNLQWSESFYWGRTSIQQSIHQSFLFIRHAVCVTSPAFTEKHQPPLLTPRRLEVSESEGSAAWELTQLATFLCSQKCRVGSVLCRRNWTDLNAWVNIETQKKQNNLNNKENYLLRLLLLFSIWVVDETAEVSKTCLLSTDSGSTRRWSGFTYCLWPR